MSGIGDRHASEHSHAPSRAADRRLLGGALALVVCFLVAEAVVGAVAGSLALLADAGHMLADAGALGSALWAARLAGRPPGGVWTFGLSRAETLSAAANGITLVAVAAVVGFEAVVRLLHPPPVAGAAVVATAIAGLVVNLAAASLVARADRRRLSVRGALAHLRLDAVAFAATLVAGLAILLSGFRRADPAASLVVVALTARTAWMLLRASGRVLLEGAPEGVDLAAVRSHLMAAPHVLGVHDLHVWTVAAELPTLSAHVVVEDSCFADGHVPRILDELQACLTRHFDVAHSSFQLEPVSHADHEASAH